jgi:hypothetical protein
MSPVWLVLILPLACAALFWYDENGEPLWRWPR